LDTIAHRGDLKKAAIFRTFDEIRVNHRELTHEQLESYFLSISSPAIISSSLRHPQ
jgi:hypothetical protein